MKRASIVKRIYYKHFAKPAAERCLFAAITCGGVRQIVEIGLGDGSRAARLIRLAIKCHSDPISYCGIDLFEASGLEGQLRFKDAFRKLNIPNCKTKLVPGEPITALATCANSLTETNLVVVSNQFDARLLDPMWMYVPRMLNAQSRVFLQDADGQFGLISRATVDLWAQRAVDLRRKSA